MCGKQPVPRQETKPNLADGLERGNRLTRRASTMMKRGQVGKVDGMQEPATAVSAKRLP